MSASLSAATLSELVCSLQYADTLLSGYRIDFYCDGERTLAETMEALDMDADARQELLDELEHLSARDQDWRTADTQALIEHILERYHCRHREQLPELIELAAKVERVHDDHLMCPKGLSQHLQGMLEDLDNHMLKEEHVLFPALLQGASVQEMGGPIHVMRHEHDEHNHALEMLFILTDHLTPPQDACGSWRRLYAGIRELSNDLMKHIHLENNILFKPR